MMRFHRPISGLVAILTVSVIAVTPTLAKVKHRHPAQSRTTRPADFPVYVDRGSDRNPGGDNLYFSDTKTPHYIVGPAWFQRWE